MCRGLAGETQETLPNYFTGQIRLIKSGQGHNYITTKLTRDFHPSDPDGFFPRPRGVSGREPRRAGREPGTGEIFLMLICEAAAP